MQNFYDDNVQDNNVIIDKSTENKIFGKTFFWMFLGLLGSAIIAAYTYYSGLYCCWRLLECSFNC